MRLGGCPELREVGLCVRCGNDGGRIDTEDKRTCQIVVDDAGGFVEACGEVGVGSKNNVLRGFGSHVNGFFERGDGSHLVGSYLYLGIGSYGFVVGILNMDRDARFGGEHPVFGHGDRERKCLERSGIEQLHLGERKAQTADDSAALLQFGEHRGGDCEVLITTAEVYYLRVVHNFPITMTNFELCSGTQVFEAESQQLTFYGIGELRCCNLLPGRPRVAEIFLASPNRLVLAGRCLFMRQSDAVGSISRAFHYEVIAGRYIVKHRLCQCNRRLVRRGLSGKTVVVRIGKVHPVPLGIYILQVHLRPFGACADGSHIHIDLVSGYGARQGCLLDLCIA